MVVKWLDDPQSRDFNAACEYLSMLAELERVQKTVAALRTAETVYRKAKDVLWAAQLAGSARHPVPAGVVALTAR